MAKSAIFVKISYFKLPNSKTWSRVANALSKNVVYLATSTKCKLQYVASTSTEISQSPDWLLFPVSLFVIVIVFYCL